MVEFSAANKMDRSHIKKGYWYYQWEDVENIKSKREVVVYRKVNVIHLLIFEYNFLSKGEIIVTIQIHAGSKGSLSLPTARVWEREKVPSS